MIASGDSFRRRRDLADQVEEIDREIDGEVFVRVIVRTVTTTDLDCPGPALDACELVRVAVEQFEEWGEDPAECEGELEHLARPSFPDPASDPVPRCERGRPAPAWRPQRARPPPRSRGIAAPRIPVTRPRRIRP